MDLGFKKNNIMTRDLKIILEVFFSLLIEKNTTPIIIIGRDKKSINKVIDLNSKKYLKL